jgi:hypothetical protein
MIFTRSNLAVSVDISTQTALFLTIWLKFTKCLYGLQGEFSGKRQYIRGGRKRIKNGIRKKNAKLTASHYRLEAVASFRTWQDCPTISCAGLGNRIYKLKK